MLDKKYSLKMLDENVMVTIKIVNDKMLNEKCPIEIEIQNN